MFVVVWYGDGGLERAKEMEMDEENEGWLFWWMVENYVEMKNGTLEDWKLKKLNEAGSDRAGNDWVTHVESELAKMGLVHISQIQPAGNA